MRCCRCLTDHPEADLLLAGDCRSGSFHLCLDCYRIVYPRKPVRRQASFGQMPWTCYEQAQHGVFREIDRE